MVEQATITPSTSLRCVVLAMVSSFKAATPSAGTFPTRKVTIPPHSRVKTAAFRRMSTSPVLTTETLRTQGAIVSSPRGFISFPSEEIKLTSHQRIQLWTSLSRDGNFPGLLCCNQDHSSRRPFLTRTLPGPAFLSLSVLHGQTASQV